MFRHVADLVLTGVGLVVILCAISLATWDVVRPCLACGCYECAGWLNNSCTTWFAWQESMDVDLWPVLWMGGLAFATLMLPWSLPFSKETAEIWLHVVNGLWLVLAGLPLAWRPIQQRCDGVGAGFALKYLGLASGRFCGVNMCLLLITVGRSSAWLEKIGTGFTEAISLHRVAGWWCVGHVVLHAASYTISYYYSGGWQLVWHKLLPVAVGAKMNTRGLLNLYGAVGITASISLAVFAIQPIRRKLYGTFYNVHIVCAVVFILMGSIHDFKLLLFVLPSCSYFVERAIAWTSQWRRCRAQLTLLTPNVARLSLSPGILNVQSHLLPGTRWLYVKVPSLSHEWHPFSITGPRDGADLYIKAVGDWSRSLCNLAQKSHELDVSVDGPFGVSYKMCPTGAGLGAVGCPFSSTRPKSSKRALLLVGGGVGIVPWADFIKMGSKAVNDWSSVTVVWAVRGDVEYQALERCLQIQAGADDRVKVQVYITGNVDDAIVTNDLVSPDSTMLTPAQLHSPDRSISLSWLLQSRLVSALVPFLLLYMVIRLNVVAAGTFSLKAWTGGVFTWSLASHGSVSAMAYVAMPVLSAVVALGVYLARQSFVALRAFLRLSNRRQGGVREINDQQLLRLSNVVGLSNEHMIARGRPDLRDTIFKFDQGINLVVRVCGPQPIVHASREAVSEAVANGRKVALEIEQAEW